MFLHQTKLLMASFKCDLQRYEKIDNNVIISHMILPGSLMELQAPGPQSVETKYKAGERKRAVVVVK